MQSATKKSEAAASQAAEPNSAHTVKRAKLSVLLVTGDDLLWPQIGAHLNSEMLLKQVDSVDELLATTPAGQPAVVLWDARGQTDAAAVLSRLQLHSPCFAVVALDDPGSAAAWTAPIALRQIIAQVAIPVLPDELRAAIDSGREEVSARTALLGGDAMNGAASPGAAALGGTMPAAAADARQSPWLPAAFIGGVLIASVGAYWLVRHNIGAVKAPAASPMAAPQPAGKASAAVDEKVDLLIEKAQQAMLERHFIDPADSSALALYRRAQVLDPDNGEARQGLQRLAEILITRVQSALDERKFDIALQSLESARSIDPADGRLAALDERITSLRAEFGPSQILAAINAQNFDRAAQLLDEAARSKSLGNAKVAQLRDELRRRHEEADAANFAKLIDTRLQQDKLTEPRNDSAAYYLTQARAAGVSAAALQPLSQEIYKRLLQSARTAIDQRRFADADRLLVDLHSVGAATAVIAGLQHDLNAARGQQSAPSAGQPQSLDLAQSRLAQGKVTEPDNDSALFYVNQLRAADPKNAALPRLSSAVQAAILDQARVALDAAQPAKADALLQLAAGLGPSADLAALTQRLAQTKQATPGMPEVAEATLTRVKGIQVEYPQDALRKNVEGWVELEYVVTSDGKVASITVVNSNPTGVFDAAAVRALSRVRYKPVLQAGKPAAVGTKMRIAFKMSK
ncbi:MAG: energy transducer TonB [Steroidobacteraceae bacterium]